MRPSITTDADKICKQLKAWIFPLNYLSSHSIYQVLHKNAVSTVLLKKQIKDNICYLNSCPFVHTNETDDKYTKSEIKKKILGSVSNADM